MPWSNQCVTEIDVATIRGIFCLIQNIIQPLPAIIALAALFMVIFAGAKIIGAGADPKALQSAWQTFTWAILGIILLSAVWLVFIAIEKITGAQVTQFGIP